MANNYTPEEIQEIFDEYHRALSSGIPVGKDLAERLKDATAGVKNYTYQLNQSVKQLGTSFKQLGKDIANGAEGAAVFNDSLSSGSDVVANFASKFGLVGTAIGGIVKAGSAYVSAVNKQSDALYKSFQDISKTGTIGAGGMSEVFNSMQKFGYAVGELNQMQSLLQQNSTALAKFGGTAYDGARALSDVAYSLQRDKLGERFRNMGLSVDEINQNAAGYVKTQIALGRSRTDVEKNLTTETAKYIEQVVAVQKLTGQTREQLEEKQAQAQREEAFAYQQYELQKRAAAGDKQATKEFERNQALSRILEGKAREQFIAGIGGDVAAMGELMRTAPDTVQQILTGGDLPSVLQNLARESKQAVDNLGPMARFHGFNNVLLPMNELLDIMSQYGGKNMKEVLDTIEKNKETVDSSTKAQTSLRISEMNARQGMENMVNAGIDPVTKAMKVLAYAVEYLTDLLPFSGRAKERYEKEQTEQAAHSAAKLTGSVLDKIIQVESGGRNIGTTGSSAYGIGQMTKGTFEGLAKKASPTSALYGKTFEDMKADVGLQREALSQLTVQNQDVLSKAGLTTDDASTYLAHFLGASGAVNVLRAPDSTPIDKVVSGQSIYANPGVFKNITTAGDLKAWAAKKMQSSAAQPAGPNNPQAAGAFGWDGTISGPMSGYRPNLLMHGTEKISITPSNKFDQTGSSSNSEMTSDLVSKIDDLISVAKAQLSVNERILKYQQ